MGAWLRRILPGGDDIRVQVFSETQGLMLKKSDFSTLLSVMNTFNRMSVQGPPVPPSRHFHVHGHQILDPHLLEYEEMILLYCFVPHVVPYLDHTRGNIYSSQQKSACNDSIVW